MKSIFQLFGVFIFTALLFVKVAALHSYCHDDSNEVQECTVCLISLENQQENFDFAYSFDFEVEQLYITLQAETGYDCIAVTKKSIAHLFSRPPPTLI